MAVGFFQKYRLYKKGFTLAEMIIVVGIIGIVTSVVLWNNRGFDSATLLANLVHDVALSIRQAQVYGISVRGDIETEEYNAGYGIHFDLTYPAEYIFFRDEPEAPTMRGDKLYVEGEDTVLNAYQLERGYSISGVYSISGSGTESSLDPSRPLSIVFVRPDPTAYFSYNGSVQNYSGVRIELSSLQGTTRSVYVTSTGQISVKE